MSTQLEFIMQLYMMNLMQQYQQQQQQQQQLQQLQQEQYQQQPTQISPSKPKDITSRRATSTARAKSTSIEGRPNTRTIKRQNSQNTNCSSSRSCSPNSNSSPTSTFMSPLQHLLLNNLSPLTQLMTHAQTQIQPPMQMPFQMPPSNLLLTPTTPNSATIAAPATATSSITAVADYLSGGLPFQLPAHNQVIANNFLQSSTVTSTPTEKSPTAKPDISHVGTDVVAKIDEDADGDVDYENDVVARTVPKTELMYEDDDDDDDDDDVEDERDGDEDEQPLSSLLGSSSGAASTSTSTVSAENSNKLLLCSGIQALESTTESFDSPSIPYTPSKQSTDTSFSAQQPLALYQETSTCLISSSSGWETAADIEDSNVTPAALTKALLTPPSSEQLLANAFESSHTAAPSGGTSLHLTTPSSLDAFLQNEENLKHLKKYSSYLECENVLCRQENLREHFHCFDAPCEGKILSKKDDIIRHLKWHKKRKESLLLGFARFSASDDCTSAYGEGCAYNWKQTHYHCVYEDCPKVYVSTSDVQMHANFHRKNSEIVQEGFRRFRAHENCKIEDCPFYGKKTSHYHCCREGCNHTFKNKADMDKHKSYHLKDYQLTQDGFKKILKTETCPFESCKFSTVCNHIHCVRGNCNYILHSSSQMISHKRKHDRLDGEQAYQIYKKQKDSSEEESPTPAPATCNVTTPLSSLSADHFLARKRGRPPKLIEMPSEMQDTKRIKQESNNEQLLGNAMPNTSLSAMFPPFLPNFHPGAAAAAQSMQSQDPNAPNFQLTHLMALFQLQNPLFYQNLYPGSMAANMASLLGAAAAGVMPQNAGMFGNLAAFGAAAGATEKIKADFQEKQQFKE